MISFSDSRSFGNSDERLSHCHGCGRELVLLPDDRRGGCCFDCLALSVPEPQTCPDCRATIPGEERGNGCANCGWYPLRD